MTYPSQPGQSPYGVPTQGGNQYGQYPAYGQQGGFGPQGPQPPKKSKTGLWVGLSIAVVAVVAFVITAFVAPGFLLSDDDDSDKSDNSAGGESQSQTSDPSAIAQQISQALSSGDTATLTGLACPDASSMVQQAIQMAGQFGQVTMNGQPQVSGNQAIAQGTAAVNGKTYPVSATLVQQGGKWCWQDADIEVQGAGGMDNAPTDMSYPGESPGVSSDDTSGTNGDVGATGGSPADSETFVNVIHTLLNSGDMESLEKLACPAYSDSVTSVLEEALSTGDTYELDEVETITTDVGALGTFVGSKGELSVSGRPEGGSFCIYHASYFPAS